MKERLESIRIGRGVYLSEVLRTPLSFKIAIGTKQTVDEFPSIFEIGAAEYGFAIDEWISHTLMSLTSEEAVMMLDGLWLKVMRSLTDVYLYLDQKDPSSAIRLRPDITAMLRGFLALKCVTKASLADWEKAVQELTSKFHDMAYKLFSSSCPMVPAIVTCNELVSLHCTTYKEKVLKTDKSFKIDLLKTYRVSEKKGRVEFIVDLFKVLRWITAQEGPIEPFHLKIDQREPTDNRHHVTLTSAALYKEFNAISPECMSIIKVIYGARLPNVEQGTTNCTSITITRVGGQLKTAMRVRGLSKTHILNGVAAGLSQLHSLGYAHCDIRASNIFVDDDNTVFIGDLEYCRLKTKNAPADLRGSDVRARTAEELDIIQFDKLSDELESPFSV